MAKEYFSHDYNARNDKKIAALVKDYKAAGYGIFWALCEILHEDGNCLEYDDLTFGLIAKDLNESDELVKSVIDDCLNKYHLFTKQNEANEAVLHPLRIVSNRVKKNLSERQEKKKAKVEAGRVGGIKSGESRKSKQNEAVLQAKEANEPKERKGTLSLSNRVEDAEVAILKSKIWFDNVCMKHGKTEDQGLIILRKFHLWLVEKEKYPQSKNQVFAGFEKWVINERQEIVSQTPVKRMVV